MKDIMLAVACAVLPLIGAAQAGQRLELPQNTIVDKPLARSCRLVPYHYYPTNGPAQHGTKLVCT